MSEAQVSKALAAAVAELERQGLAGWYVDVEDPNYATLDGNFDLVAIVRAVVSATES